MTTAHPIPDAALESDIAILGKKGRGKSYTARGLVERLLDAGRQVVVLDPLSTWWGLKAGPHAYPIAVLGGPHADLPLDEAAGEALGRYLATSEQSVVIDLGEMRKAEMVRFATPFLEELYTGNRKPLWLVLEEADVFAPQQPQPETARMLGEVDRIARRGRQFGFKLISLTQRPARLNKDVLTQLSTLVALGLTSPQDRDAIKAWVEGAGDRDKAKEVLSTLASLKVGEGWVWAPDHDILERVRFPKIKTPDTSATPKVGEKRAPAKVRADVDVAALREAMSTFSSTNEDEKMNTTSVSGPKVRAGKVKSPASVAELAAADRQGYERGLVDGEGRGLERGARAGWKAAATLFERDVMVRADLFADNPRGHEDGEAEIARALGLAAWPKPFGSEAVKTEKPTAKYSQKYSAPPEPPPATTVTKPNGTATNGALPPAKRKILDALAWLESIGQDAPARNVVAFVGGISSKKLGLREQRVGAPRRRHGRLPGERVARPHRRRPCACRAPNAPARPRRDDGGAGRQAGPGADAAPARRGAGASRSPHPRGAGGRCRRVGVIVGLREQRQPPVVARARDLSGERRRACGGPAVSGGAVMVIRHDLGPKLSKSAAAIDAALKPWQAEMRAWPGNPPRMYDQVKRDAIVAALKAAEGTVRP